MGWCARAWCSALAQIYAKSFDGCAAACAWSGRWHEMCAHLLTRYTPFQSFKRHNIAIITHAKCHGNYDLKQAKIGKIALEMCDKA